MFRFALGNLRSRPLRSLLAVLGLTVAIGGMVGLFSIAGGIEEMVSRTFEQIPGLLIQQRGAPVPIFSTLPTAWEKDLKAISGVEVVNAEVLTRINIIEKKTIISPPRFLLGLDIPSRLKLKRCPYRENLVAGRFLTEEDIGTTRCIVSRNIASEFKKQVGDTLQIGRTPCQIVGIYHTGSMMLDGNILMDLGTSKTMTRYAADSVSCYYVEIDRRLDREAVKSRIEEAFLGRELEGWTPGNMFGGFSRGNPISSLLGSIDRSLKGESNSPPNTRELPPTEFTAQEATPVNSDATRTDEPESAVEIRAAEDWADRFAEFTGDLNIFLTLITAVGIVIAVLSIINTMLMSVTERTIEFGILRANGWAKLDIVKLITFESALLGLIGGCLGSVLGWAATHVINATFSDRVSLFASPSLILFSIAFSTAIGLFSGVYPAWLAARMSPMEAIRRG